jgi:hypothetical protein
MLVRPGHRLELVLSAILAAITVVTGLALQRRHGPVEQAVAASAAEGDRVIT